MYQIDKKIDGNVCHFEELKRIMEEEYLSLKVGDVIWAKRYITEEERLKIPEGHREGPYVVVGKVFDKLNCLYCSGIEFKKVDLDYYNLKIDNSNYSMEKITYVHITNNVLITKDRFISKFTTLTDEDKKYLYKKMGIVADKGMYWNTKIDIPKIPLETGDIFCNGKDFYLIVSETDEKFLCMKLLKKDHGFNNFIMLNQEKYYLNFSNLKHYSRQINFKRYSFVDNQYLKYVLVLLQQKLENTKRMCEISEGSLIRINETFYYVYGELDDNWKAFSVLGQSNNSLCHLIVGNKHFYTDFNSMVHFSKKIKNVDIIAVATKEEMELIKNNKEKYLKEYGLISSVFPLSSNVKKPEIKMGTIVEISKYNSSILYIVVLREENEVVAIKYESYKNGNYVINKFLVNNLKKIGNINNLDLKKVLIDIKYFTTDSYISKEKIDKIVRKLENVKVNNKLLSKQ